VSQIRLAKTLLKQKTALSLSPIAAAVDATSQPGGSIQSQPALRPLSAHKKFMLLCRLVLEVIARKVRSITAVDNTATLSSAGVETPMPFRVADPVQWSAKKIIELEAKRVAVASSSAFVNAAAAASAASTLRHPKQKASYWPMTAKHLAMLQAVRAQVQSEAVL